MLFALIVVSVIASVCFGCWMWAEAQLADALEDLDVALGWNDDETRNRARAGHALHLIDGGES